VAEAIFEIDELRQLEEWKDQIIEYGTIIDQKVEVLEEE